LTAIARFADRSRPGADPKDEPQLRILQPRAPDRRDRRLLAVVGGGLLFAAVLGGNVAVQAQTTQGQFELERLQTTTRQRQAHYQQLRLRVAELEAPQRIVARARQMGMAEPSGVTYLAPTAATSATSAIDPPPTSVAPPTGPIQGEAAQGWADVKPRLDKRR